MLKIKHKVVLVFILISDMGFSMACNCETTLPEISREETEQYSLIFTGYVKNLYVLRDKPATEYYAEFVVNKPFKGLVPRDIKIFYDGSTSCQMHFLPGDEWLLYVKKDSVDKKWTVNYCERSRRYAEPGEEDQYTIYSGMTLEEELKFLETNYASGQVVGEDTLTMIEEEDKIVIDSRRDVNYGTPRQKIILLACSLLGMIIIYFIIRKFVK
jgi:hypothetical protein